MIVAFRYRETDQSAAGPAHSKESSLPLQVLYSSTHDKPGKIRFSQRW